ncbi:MAG TPA: methyltransferase domain-containing protein [Ktedonobacterales bacterium]|nr:methyltransferase domain-containing protein [Ktedonobacterales bacterium]
MSYIGAHDPEEAARLALQEAGADEELHAALALHRPPADVRVLELGSGTGVYTRAVLVALPEATVVGLDRDVRLLAEARANLAAEIAAGRVTLLEGDVARLPFDPQSFGLVTCRCVLMHQPEPELVASEMFRVAEVGGVGLAIEPDWGARAVYPDPEAYAEFLELARRARSFGFPDLLQGRKLPALFQAAGFAQIRAAATAFVETAAMRAANDAETLTGPARLLEQARTLLRRADLAGDADLDALIARLAGLRRHPEYFSGGADFAVSAVKPGPRWTGEGQLA